MKKIKVNEEIKSSIAVSPQKGEILYQAIRSYLDNKEEVLLDFSDVKQLTTAFLNNAIGSLYRSFDSEYLNKYLRVSGLDELDKYLFTKVIKRSKLNLSEIDGLDEELKGD